MIVFLYEGLHLSKIDPSGCESLEKRSGFLGFATGWQCVGGVEDLGLRIAKIRQWPDF